jgi:hypothetical protein
MRSSWHAPCSSSYGFRSARLGGGFMSQFRDVWVRCVIALSLLLAVALPAPHGYSHLHAPPVPKSQVPGDSGLVAGTGEAITLDPADRTSRSALVATMENASEGLPSPRRTNRPGPKQRPAPRARRARAVRSPARRGACIRGRGRASAPRGDADGGDPDPDPCRAWAREARTPRHTLRTTSNATHVANHFQENDHQRHPSDLRSGVGAFARLVRRPSSGTTGRSSPLRRRVQEGLS